MTTQCGGGTSSVRTGVAASVAYTSALIADLLVLVESPWLIPVIPLLTLPPIATAGFCATDPPSMPTFTTNEANALLQLQFGTADWNSGVTKVSNALQNAIWSQLCQCDTTSTPGPSVGPTPPSGVNVPQFQTQPGFAPCSQYVYTGTSSLGGTNFTWVDWAIGSVTPTSFTYTFVNKIHDGTGASQQFIMDQAGSAGDSSPLRTDTFTVPQNTTLTFTVPAAAGVISIFGKLTSTGTGGTLITGTTLSAFCSSQGLPSGQQSCPPDPAVLGLLEAIMRMLTVIQRSYAPFGYVLGTSSSGLTGTGSVSVSRCIGVKVAVTAYPPTDQVLPGNPSYIKDLGWISMSETDGMIQEYRIARAAFTWFPELAPLADHINYFLQPGVTATITPIFPEA